MDIQDFVDDMTMQERVLATHVCSFHVADDDIEDVEFQFIEGDEMTKIEQTGVFQVGFNFGFLCEDVLNKYMGQVVNGGQESGIDFFKGWSRLNHLW